MAGTSPLGFPEDEGLLLQLSNAINHQATHPGGGEQNNRTYFMENMWLGHFSARTACLGFPRPHRVGHPRWKLESPEGLFPGRSGGGHQLLAGTCPWVGQLVQLPRASRAAAGFPHGVVAGPRASAPETGLDGIWITFLALAQKFHGIISAAFCSLEVSHEGWPTRRALLETLYAHFKTSTKHFTKNDFFGIAL